MPKVFQCSSCGGQHKRPVGAKCQYKNNDNAESTLSGTQSTQSTSENTNAEILNALKTAIEQRIDRTEEQLHSRPLSGTDAAGNDVSTSSSQEVDEMLDTGDDAVIPSTQFLKKMKPHISCS